MIMRAFIVLLLLLLPSACAMPKKPVIFAGAGTETVSVKPRQIFTVALNGNPSTGFSWNIVAIDSAKVRPQGKPRFVARSDLPGAAGTFYFDFKALSKGSSKVKLAYFRTWEKGVAPVDSFAITVDCR